MLVLLHQSAGHWEHHRKDSTVVSSSHSRQALNITHLVVAGGGDAMICQQEVVAGSKSHAGVQQARQASRVWWAGQANLGVCQPEPCACLAHPLPAQLLPWLRAGRAGAEPKLHGLLSWLLVEAARYLHIRTISPHKQCLSRSHTGTELRCLQVTCR